ncbi:hypothetical protein E2C01_000132 [Portunus trituberculatus]|uniref:Uncharacterized protein n=1 Tax=Portunus trituberculatus TaxID=210409 RepID=A0A5B7CEA6_PORTR|nr:hypothetical protein [Portunus trituberculatus]
MWRNKFSQLLSLGTAIEESVKNYGNLIDGRNHSAKKVREMKSRENKTCPGLCGGHEGQPSFNMTDDTIPPPSKQNYRTVQTKDDCNL